METVGIFFLRTLPSDNSWAKIKKRVTTMSDTALTPLCTTGITPLVSPLEIWRSVTGEYQARGRSRAGNISGVAAHSAASSPQATNRTQYLGIGVEKRCGKGVFVERRIPGEVLAENRAFLAPPDAATLSNSSTSGFFFRKFWRQNSYANRTGL